LAVSAYCNGTILFYKKTIQEKKHIIMRTLFQKKIIIPVVASAFLFVGVSFKDDYFEIAKQLEIFTTLFKELNKNYVDETTPAELMNNAIKGMLNSLDPYTVYFNEQEVLKFKINNTGEYTGVGALITRKDDKLILKEPYKNFPADKAGLKAGDEITQIGDTPLADFKDDASQLFKGSKNTKIDVKYIRQGKPYSTVIVLDEVEIKSVPYFAKIDDKTGYIVLAHFNKKASNETREALEQLKKEGAERIVLDLRGNPGGLLNEAVNICNLFVAKNEIIVTTKSKIEKHNNTYKTSKEPVDTTIPLVILVNGRSASASEIVSGALQDLDRAVVLGSRSFGKGLVQRPVELTYGTQLKVTISRYYTPSGRCIQALDYAHKDKNGVATRTDAKNYNTFKTRKGRTVYDGGGVLPDIEMEETKTSPIANALLKNDGIFNFVTQYYYKNPNLGTKIPVLTDADYSEFKQFLKIQKLSFDTETELALKNTLATAKKEKLDEGIAIEYQQLLTALQKTENALLDKNQKEIKGLLLDEIIKRYQYQEGLYDYYIKNNPEIKKAVSILNTSTAYNSILKI
jgi:carboxyl-terminal processing protease